MDDEDWFSDCGDEDDLDSMSGREDDSNPKQPVFKESTKLNSLNLVVGMNKMQNIIGRVQETGVLEMGMTLSLLVMRMQESPQNARLRDVTGGFMPH